MAWIYFARTPAAWQGTGTILDPYRLRRVPDRGGISFCPPGQADPRNWPVLAAFSTKQPPAWDDFLFADDLDVPLSAALATKLETRFGITLAERTNLRRVLRELFIDHSRLDGTRWAPLRPTVDRRYEIMLGGQKVWEMPVISGGSSYTETWSTADNASLTSDLTWTEFDGQEWAIVSNKARLTGAVDETKARADHDLASVDHYSQVTLSTLDTAGGVLIYLGTMCRRDDTGTNTFYIWMARPENNTYEAYRCVAGSYTQLTGSPVSFAPAAGQVSKLECNGSTIKGYVDAVEKFSVTDSNITTGLRCGMYGWSSTAGSMVEADNWSAADLAAVAAAARRRTLLGVGT